MADTKSNLTSNGNEITELSGVGTEETNSITYESSSGSDNVSLTHIDGLTETSVNEDSIISGGFAESNDEKVNSPSLIPKIEVSENDSADSDDDIYGKLLATFVVGRRFGEVEELHIGESISLCRDPENIKDPNAVKVNPFFFFFRLVYDMTPSVLQMLKHSHSL